ncbi:hypothetical protein BJ742DRAFT_817807 [Cladochytrium replicatum]|nr:hypothetical protein BJ742DRAFT_817807 [Cladochytrium replicatum]
MFRSRLAHLEVAAAAQIFLIVHMRLVVVFGEGKALSVIHSTATESGIFLAQRRVMSSIISSSEYLRTSQMSSSLVSATCAKDKLCDSR